MSKTITFFSTKGGVGKTLIASNTAICLAKNEAKRVCLIDLDLRAFGNMARMLSLNPQKCLADFMRYPIEEVTDVKKETLITETPYGLEFIPAVLKPSQAPQINPAKIKEILTLLEKDYDYIIIDAGSTFSETFISTLNCSNLILLVATPDVISIYQTKWILDTLQALYLPLEMIKIVLNRTESASSISEEEVMYSLPVKIIARLPSEGKIVGQAINTSIPVVIDSSRSKIALAIKKFAHDLSSTESLFIPHTTIDQLRLRSTSGETDATIEFWRRYGLAAPEEDMESIEKVDEIVMIKRRIHARLFNELDLKRLDWRTFAHSQKLKELKDKTQTLITNILTQEAGTFIPSLEVRKKLVKEIVDEALGLGPLEDLLADKDISDIMVNNKDEVYIEKNGKIELTSKKFITNEQVKTVIERILQPIGRHIDESSPMVDARLPDGSRVNAIIPPLALTGPSLTIRKFKPEAFTVEDLMNLGTLNKQMGDFLNACVLSRKNMIVSGGTGSGKTTVLNVLSLFISNNERIITIEDSAELKLKQEHWVRLESRPPNIEGRGAITIRELFRNTLRMRPDRIIIGECRSMETLDMLQAMNTGHDGSMTTVHANSTHDAVTRLDSMILMSGIELPIRAIREMIASAIDIIVHTARLSDGTRKIIQITEIVGLKDELHIDLRDIILFKQTGIDEKGNVLGYFTPTGYIPSFIDDIKVRGIPISEDVFTPSTR